MKANNYLWVPEDCIFESAGDCIEAHPSPPACLVASHVAYEKAVGALKELLVTLYDSDEIECLNLVRLTLNDLEETLE